MDYSHRYPAYPTQQVAAELEHHIDIHRQAYNYTLYEYEHVDTDDIGSAYRHHYRLPGWKDEFPVFSEVYSKALQRTVERFYQNLDSLSAQKQNGRKVGKLNWKSPSEFQSMIYSQSGHQKSSTSGWQPEISDFWRRLRTQKHEWPERDALALQNRRDPDSLPSRDSFPSRHQRSLH